jgi:hypothetical protein
MKTEVLLLFFCLFNPKPSVVTESTATTPEAGKIVIEARIDMFSPLFLIDL